MSSGESIRFRRVAEKGGGKGGGGKTPARPVEYNNTLRSRATARIMEVISEGPIQGVHGYDGVNWQTLLQGLLLDGTPVYDQDLNENFRLLESHLRFGYPTQDPIPGFPMAEATFAVGVELKPFDPVIRRLSHVDISAFRYTIRFPAIYMTENDGDVNGTTVSYEVHASFDGGPWQWIWAEEIWGKSSSPYEKTVHVQLAPYLTATTSIDVKITRTWGEAGEGETKDMYWQAYTEIQDGLLAHDDTALWANVIDSEEFPSVPQRAYLIDGLQVQVPNNYNSQTGEYTGDWNGGFVTAWTNNPAWVLYALLTNERWGLGRFLDAAAIDKWSFYDAGKFNDQYVTNGRGGWERRWLCNCVINTRQDAWALLNAVASCMLGTLYFASGTVFMVQDRGQVLGSQRLFGTGDVVNGLFDYLGTDYRSKFTAAAVTWNDPEDMYRPAVELVQDALLVAQQGFKETQQTAFGCTSRSQAIRYGRWLIYTSQYETEVVTFQVGLDNADVRPGEIVAIADPSRMGARLAGRLLEDNGADTVTLDRISDAMYHGIGGWVIYFQVGSAPQGNKPPSIFSANVTEILPDTQQLRLSSKPAGLVPGTTWLLAATTTVWPSWWRVISVADRSGGIYEITATEADLHKMHYIDNGWTWPEPPHSLIPTGPLLPPSNFSFTEFIYLDAQGRPQFGVLMSWTASTDPRVARYQLEISGPNGDYRRFEVPGVTQEALAMRQGGWQVALRAFDNIGRKSTTVWSWMDPIGLSVKPSPPTSFFVTPQGGNLITLTWTPTSEIDVVWYWIKWTSNKFGALWATATTSIAAVDRNTTQINTPLRSGTFMIKSVDSLGQESDGWAAVVLNDQLSERVLVADAVQEPAWAGDRGALWTLTGDQLWLPPPAAPEPIPPGVFPGDRRLALNSTPTRVAVYGFASGLDLGTPTLVTMTGYFEGSGAKGSNTMSTWIPLASAVPLAGGASEEWDAHIEARVSQDASTWGEWFPLKSTVITGRRFEWRMVGAIYDLATTLKADHASVTVELPPRTLHGQDLAVDGTGHATVTYATPFTYPPTVQITAWQNLVAGGTVVIVESDETHFKVQHRNASGTAVTGASIDWTVVGYGGSA